MIKTTSCRGWFLWALIPFDLLGCERIEVPNLSLGKQIFADNFERTSIGPNWTTSHKGWVIKKGWVHSSKARNEGLWLNKTLPENVLIRFDVRSEPKTDGTAFPGDIKCEVFATKKAHQAGYVILNGGWSNKLDIIARLDEHGTDVSNRHNAERTCRGKCRKKRKAKPVVESTTYRWTIARYNGAVYWFRDGGLEMVYNDPDPVGGGYLGFNNWESNVYYDNLEIWSLN